MKTLLQAFAALIIVMIIALIGFMIGRHSYPKCPTIEVRTDTVVRVDTLRDTVLIPITRYITRIETDILKIAGDTVYVAVEIPIERKTYQTADYRAEIEGYRPSLVSMEVYRQTQFIDRVQTVKVPDVRRWGIGIQAGYGASIQNGKIAGVPYVGVGVQYSIIRW